MALFSVGPVISTCGGHTRRFTGPVVFCITSVVIVFDFCALGGGGGGGGALGVAGGVAAGGVASDDLGSERWRRWRYPPACVRFAPPPR